jgi:hypothetical protein
MKKKEKTTDGITYANFNPEHPEFYKWWKKHRHSGYVEDREGKAHWNTLPAEAWYIDKYRVEFSIETGSPYKSEHEYSMEEIEKWALEQKEMEEYVGGDYSCVPINEFTRVMEDCLSKLRATMEARGKEAKRA